MASFKHIFFTSKSYAVRLKMHFGCAWFMEIRNRTRGDKKIFNLRLLMVWTGSHRNNETTRAVCITVYYSILLVYNLSWAFDRQQPRKVRS
jgi:hypothetical protein